MKRKTIFQMVVFSVIVGFGIVACSSNNQNSSSAQLEKISITNPEGKTSATIILGSTLQLTPSVEGVTWDSSKQDVATVDANGLVTSVGAGSTSITAKKSGYRDGTFSLKVDLEKIVITASGSTELLVGGTVTLTASKTGVTWTSSDNDIASVSTEGVVTANKLGEATITASKTGFANGTQAIKIVRPTPTAVLSMDDADHYSPTGQWAGYNETYETPVYLKEQASGGQCVAHFAEGCKETLTFTSTAAVKAEVCVVILARSSYTDLAACFGAKFNGTDVATLTNVEYAGSADYPSMEVSLGEFTLNNSNNVLEFNFLGDSPYLDDVKVYAVSATTIAVVKPEAKPLVNVDKTEAEIVEGATVQINSTTDGVSYVSSNTGVAIVSDTGLVRGISSGTANINVRKEGMTSAKVAITVTESTNAIKVEAESGTSDEANPVTFRQSQGSSGVTFTDSFPVGAVLTLTLNDVQAGDFLLTMAARGIRGSGYTYSAVDLKTAMELKVNGTEVDLTDRQVPGSSSIGVVYLGDVTLAATNTITIKALADMPTIDYLRVVPKA